MKVVKRCDGRFTIKTDENGLYENTAYNWTKDGYEILSEEDEEIDIDSIEEYEEYFIVQANSSEDVKDLARKYNILLKAVKQINKKLEEK